MGYHALLINNLSRTSGNTMEEKQQKTSIPPAAQTTGQPQAGQPQQQQQVHLDDADAATTYANFCRVTGTPEEVILDLGLNIQPFGPSSSSIPVTQRVVMNYFTAKRMLGALQMTVQRHEAAFGVLETDVQKRVKQPAPGAAGGRP